MMKVLPLIKVKLVLSALDQFLIRELSEIKK